MRTTPQQDNKPAPIGAGVDKQKPVGIPAVELPTEPKMFGQPPSQPVSKDVAPTPPVESKPTAAEVKATADSLSANKPATNNVEPKSVPTGPRSTRITPAVPIPAAILSRSGSQAIAATASVKPAVDPSNSLPSAAALKDATQAAKAAVAVAMAKLDNPNAAPGPVGPSTANSAMDNLTKK